MKQSIFRLLARPLTPNCFRCQTFPALNSIIWFGSTLKRLSETGVSDILIYNFFFFFPSDVDECASDPCLNGALCSDQINGYACSCTRGFTGIFCEIGK